MRHGTGYAYKKRSCRCEQCRAWRREKSARRTRRYQPRIVRTRYGAELRVVRAGDHKRRAVVLDSSGAQVELGWSEIDLGHPESRAAYYGEYVSPRAPKSEAATDEQANSRSENAE